MNSLPLHTSITLATKITLLRILGIPVFVLLLIYYKMGLADGLANERYRFGALVIFVVIAATDALDGYLARRRDEETRLGTILDPLADKALLLSAIILLTHPSLFALSPQFPVWFTLVVISRDIVLLVGTCIVHWMSGHVEVYPRLIGKVATVLQMAAVVFALADLNENVFLGFVVAAAVFTLISGLQYLIDGTRQLETSSHV